MELPTVGLAMLGLGSSEQSIQQVLAVLLPPSALTSAVVVAPGGEPRVPGTQNAVPFQSGMGWRSGSLTGWKRGGGRAGRLCLWGWGEGEMTEVQIEAGWGFRCLVSGGTERYVCTPSSARTGAWHRAGVVGGAEMNGLNFVLNRLCDEETRFVRRSGSPVP